MTFNSLFPLGAAEVTNAVTFYFYRVTSVWRSEIVGKTLSQFKICLSDVYGTSYILVPSWIIITYFGTCHGVLASSCLQMFITR